MTKAEKRYFKVYSSRHSIGEKNNYVRLFDAIEKQKQHNDEELIKTFRKEKLSKRIHVVQSRLYELVLKSLSAYSEIACALAPLFIRLKKS